MRSIKGENERTELIKGVKELSSVNGFITTLSLLSGLDSGSDSSLTLLSYSYIRIPLSLTSK